MSVQIAGLAPGDAGRVAEARADARQRSSSWLQARGGLGDEDVGQHVRQVRDGGQHAVVRLGVDRDGRAPSATSTGRAGARRGGRSERSVGVRYQAAPSNRSARVPTPADSAPATGWPPMKRSSTAAASVRLVEPTSVTTVSGGAASSASRDQRGQGADGGAGEDRVGARDRARLEPRGTVDRTALDRGGERASASGRSRRPRRRTRSRAASPIDPPIRPTPRTATRTRDRWRYTATTLPASAAAPSTWRR